MSYINFELKAPQARPGPCRALEWTASLHYRGSAPAFLVGVHGALLFNDRVLSDAVRAVGGFGIASTNGAGSFPSRIDEKAGNTWVQLVAPLSRDALHYLTQAPPGDMKLQLDLRYQVKCALNEPDPAVEGIYWGAECARSTIPHSDWLKLLTQMEWDDLELVELRRASLVQHATLGEALKRLGQAQAHMRDGDYRDVVNSVFAALESAARYTARGAGSEDKREGFEALWKQALGSYDDGRRGDFNGLVKAFNTYLSGFRHEGAPAIAPSRTDAEFVLGVATLLFSLISRGLPMPKEGP